MREKYNSLNICVIINNNAKLFVKTLNVEKVTFIDGVFYWINKQLATAYNNIKWYMHSE